MHVCTACNHAKCECMDANGPKQPYVDPCEDEHDFDEDEDAGELVCMVCGHCEPAPLDW